MSWITVKHIYLWESWNAEFSGGSGSLFTNRCWHLCSFLKHLPHENFPTSTSKPCSVSHCNLPALRHTSQRGRSVSEWIMQGMQNASLTCRPAERLRKMRTGGCLHLHVRTHGHTRAITSKDVPPRDQWKAVYCIAENLREVVPVRTHPSLRTAFSRPVRVRSWLIALADSCIPSFLLPLSPLPLLPVTGFSLPNF